MIRKITLHDLDEPIILESDIAGQEPIYILCKNSELFYSKNIVELLDGKKLPISSKVFLFYLKMELFLHLRLFIKICIF